MMDTNKNMIYDNFEKVCMKCNLKEIKNYVEQYNIDVNYNDGYFLELIAERNNVELFDLMVQLGGNIHLNNEGSLRLVAHEGYIELLDYIIKHGGNYNILIGSSALTNYKTVNTYINTNCIEY